MHTEIFNNIDILIDMANSSLSIDEINSELISLKKQIKNKRNEIDDLKSLMTEARYFNASNELVDKNIEISLKNKITRLNRKIKDLKSQIDEIKSSEEAVYNNITSLKDELAQNEGYITKLKTKAESTENNQYYADLLAKEENSVALLTKELEEKNNNYNDILKELELNNQAYTELKESLQLETSRLNDTLENLGNPNTYIDTDLKAQDEEKLSDLEAELTTLEKRKIELLTDAHMIGTEAKELIADNSIMDAINKIKELVTIVKSKPYMDINSRSILDEELEKKESLRIELSNLIDNKNYEEEENTSVSTRIDYLTKEIESYKNTITIYRTEINSIDSFVNDTLGLNITNIEEKILTLEKNISEIHTFLKGKQKSSRSRASLENALSKKEKEKEILNNILASYK
ncbi:MAG: hypothetical protein K2J20_02420, partial [Bacilli bacterium]|nr:hypothetical protein [Bacilli bacterium]